jgi:hypothetical protein
MIQEIVRKMKEPKPVNIDLQLRIKQSFNDQKEIEYCHKYQIPVCLEH